ncbi:hypothetical protein Pla123a_01370 [Posidoniimonas polymericola]|uniref:PEP-CTERM protein-sorting domain-containing protein n=1 Tax=Posidoniimonas polymericola TaxID=2528002 RepID=A0A5C5ZDT9_9BACT|nr:hypothetical protein [Posidoniimonas polymericola]TWT85330.1 hypothetical protein Pla123a_01370 [Posidoniimonas polymericola]
MKQPTTRFAFTAAALLLAAAPSPAQMYINEVFFNPGGNGSDARDEFIELRGAANAPLTDHYLLIIESENNGETGFIENILDLGAYSLGANGFLVMRQAFSLYGAPDAINPLATDLVNTGPPLPGPTFPGFGDGVNSTIGASDLPSLAGNPGEGQLEGSGFTAMLIHNQSGDAPMLGQDLDDGDDGLDLPTGAAGWKILDSVGFITELDELDGRVYGRANFITVDAFVEPGFVPNVEPDADYAFLDFEVEYLGRWGNSTGFTTDDWHASNFTDNPGSGSAGVNDLTGSANDSIDWRQSLIGNHPVDDGDPNTPAPPAAEVESSKNVPYGTKLANTLGGPNYVTGDYNGDGYVDAADYTVWRDTQGQTGSESAHPAADHNHDFLVDAADYTLWSGDYGAPNGAAPNGGVFAAAAAPLQSATQTPEPAAIALLALAVGGVARRQRA